ncbi:CPBP family intramembrane glutamic endopeptidase [Nocardiopsis deserti]|uniref:CPBP family intramembrane glutamic endopeptidase n=1 Tax=Nocardiopsis deserti TaxID=2605988 RepID=UPI001CC26C45|nr:CPBP family intramembrane glutamic endopeptidase [Nocardiopsis deserti]
MEEPVVDGLLVALLGAARCPVWEVYTVAVLAKAVYHLTYGLPVPALIPAALVIVWLYHRTGRLWPVIIAHSALVTRSHTIIRD